MSALETVTVSREYLASRLEWPPRQPGEELAVRQAPRHMRESDFGHWTPEGRETLRRILERVLRANGRRP